jgi:multimeric flavodoxin WrbA
MRALILNASLAPDPLLDQLTTRLTADFVARRYAVESFTLRDIQVAYCQGCFDCWTKTPGTCKIDDAGRALSAAFTVCDTVVIVTPTRCCRSSAASMARCTTCRATSTRRRSACWR